MAKNFEEFIKTLKPVNPPANLRSAILEKISLAQSRRAKRQLVFYSGLTAVSLVGLIPIFVGLIQSLVQSGFSGYSSLLLENGVIGFWKELTLSLAESLPIASLIFFLAVLLLFLWSLSKTIRNSKAFSYHFN